MGPKACKHYNVIILIQKFLNTIFACIQAATLIFLNNNKCGLYLSKALI
jgi:hypothetical protein